MNNKVLRELKINETFVMTPSKFLRFFGGSIQVDKKFKKPNLHELHYILGDKMQHASKHLVTLENILNGKIILVGKPNDFEAYHRPINDDNFEEIIPVKEIKEEKKVETITEVPVHSLIYLFHLYEEADADMKSVYMEEIYNRVYSDEKLELQPSREKIRVKTHMTVEE